MYVYNIMHIYICNYIYTYIYMCVCGASVGGRLSIGFVSFSNPNSCCRACVRPSIYFDRSMLLYLIHFTRLMGCLKKWLPYRGIVALVEKIFQNRPPPTQSISKCLRDKLRSIFQITIRASVHCMFDPNP